MKMKAVLQWLFVYLPVRFSLPFLGLLTWFLFYIWPWLLDLAFPSDGGKEDIRHMVRSWLVQHLVPGWIETLNLTPAAKAAAVLALLLAGILVVYNVAALWYQLIRCWSRQSLLIGTLVLNLFIYSYPWLFAPKDWAIRSFFLLPFYVRRPWTEGFAAYGVLWLLPAVMMIASLSFELIDRRREKLKPSARGGETPAIENKSFEQLLKSRDLRIGLILSGGGAKGVYQAGAMKAIHEFLKAYGCLKNVKMIAGTSIGSWNSMFWLADVVASPSGKPSVQEEWWRTTNVERIIEFDAYIPFLNNSILRPKPWRENFNALFAKSSGLQSVLEDRESIHFYLTRSNVAQGRLEFSTNWGKEQRARALQSEDIQIDSFKEPQNIDEIRDAVFASMDLPPLFPYQEMDGEYFEDGGVIDNLPIRFGTFVEQCDLLFVLALNSSFETVPGQRSILKRLARVMDVRQGVLERNSMRMAYLYNNINKLRDGNQNAASKSQKVVRIFAICPNQPLAVNTAEFWKTDQFPSAFRTMYEATRVELSKFDFMVEPAAQSADRRSDWLRMALVSQAGEITYNDRF